jgi:hypothetical protein
MLFAIPLTMTAGCAGAQQLPPTVHSLTMTVQSPPATAAKWFAFKETVASGATTCDAPTSTNFKQLNAAGQASSVYVDLSSAGTTVCEFMQYQDSATPPATSAASNVVGPYAIAANPTAPAINAQQATNAPPLLTPLNDPELARARKDAKGDKPELVAEVR